MYVLRSSMSESENFSKASENGNKDGQTPLHLPACGGQLEVVSLLLAGEADSEAYNRVRRMVGRLAIGIV